MDLGIVDTIAFGGSGIVRHNGLTVFVPFVMPGEEIQFEITSRKKSFAKGQLLEIVKKSPHRIEPPCRHFGICGGCQLQHINYQTQVALKKQFILDALTRVGKIKNLPDFEVEPASTIWAYRRHIRLKMWPTPSGYQLGFVGQEIDTLVPIQECPIFLSDEDREVLDQIKTAVSQVKLDPKIQAYVSVLKSGKAFIVSFYFSPSAPKGIEIHPSWAGATITDDSGTREFGKTRIDFSVDGARFEASPFVFLQNHAEQSEKIYKQLVQQINALSLHSVLDLYCGIGISSILLGRTGLKVAGIESNPRSIEFARKNAAANNLAVEWHTGTAEDLLPQLLHPNLPDAVVMNPPRTGLKPEVVDALIAHRPKHLFYVSCMPPTLARDLQKLTAAGYQIQSLRGFDMFPQTTHVETLVHLSFGA